MSRATIILTVGLLVCFISSSSAGRSVYDSPSDNKSKAKHQYISECEGITFRYRLESLSTLSLESKCNETKISISLDALVRPLNPQGTVLSVAFKNVDVSVLRENAESIKLFPCAWCRATAVYLKRPFLVNLDRNGALNDIRLEHEEDELSVNLKLYGASFFTINRPTEQLSSVIEKKELTLEGTCHVKEKTLQSTNKEFFIFRKNLNLAECSEVSRTSRRNNGLTCLSNTCNHASKKDLIWTGENHIQIQMINGRPIMREFNLKQQFKYKPHKDQDNKLHGDVNVNVELLSTKPEKDVDITNVDLADVVVNQMRYSSMDKDICRAHGIDRHNKDLKQLYSALQCEQSFAALYGNILGNAIECSI